MRVGLVSDGHNATGVFELKGGLFFMRLYIDTINGVSVTPWIRTIISPN